MRSRKEKKRKKKEEEEKKAEDDERMITMTNDDDGWSSATLSLLYRLFVCLCMKVGYMYLYECVHHLWEAKGTGIGKNE